jgi:hypothetical protein
MTRLSRAGVAAPTALAVACLLAACSTSPAPVGSEPSATATARCSSPVPADPRGWPFDAIQMPPASLADGAGVTVAIIDSGLADGVIPPELQSTQSQSLVEGEELTDDDGHGSQMAELVHAVAPAASILAIKAIDRSGHGSTTTISRAVDFAVEESAEVILLSLEGGAESAELRTALDAASTAGALIVIAAGNQQLDLDRFPRFPASYDIADAVVVAAVDEAGVLASGSNWGVATVDVAAPGSDIPAIATDGSTMTIDGSSPAAALTAGAAALILSALSQSQGFVGTERSTMARDALIDTAAPRASLQGKVASGGELDVASAISCAQGTS